MFLHILQALFVLLMAGVGWSYINNAHTLAGPNSWLALGMAISFAVIMVCIDILAPRKKLAIFSGTFFGLLVGTLIAYALSFVTPLILDQYQALTDQVLLTETRNAITNYFDLFIGLTTSYLAISFILQTKDDFRFIIPYVEFRKQTKGARPILLDTSVLIDGRICGIARSGIIESQLIVPRFILQELQMLADGADKQKRTRGRHGLDALAELKGIPKVEVIDYDSSGRADATQPVDEQLLHVAKDLNGRILTNDLNLNKVAGLRGVDVINLNELANAVKTVVLPGERMVVTPVKPGEEQGQAVGYLEDGTMVVVEQARQHIGEEIEFTVTNTRQTSAGKMIFGRMGEGAGAVAPRRQRPRTETQSPT